MYCRTLVGTEAVQYSVGVRDMWFPVGTEARYLIYSSEDRNLPWWRGETLARELSGRVWTLACLVTPLERQAALGVKRVHN